MSGSCSERGSASAREKLAHGLLALALVAGCTRSDPSPAPAAPSRGTLPARPAAAGRPVAKPLADTSAASTAAVAAPASGLSRYSWDRVHSPIDARVAARLRAIAESGPEQRANVFMKVGDSVTASDDFLRCFSGTSAVYGEHGELAEVVERFRAGDAAGENPFLRQSEAAKIGWSAWQALAGVPSPLEREMLATRARYALVMFGTNDIEIGNLHYFVDRMFAVAETLAKAGVIPILSTIMPRRDSTKRAGVVPAYNAAIRGIAQALQVPLIDYNLALSRIPGEGLAADHIHPSTFSGARGKNACAFVPAALAHGFNLKNLLSLEALSRVTQALDTGEPLDETPRALTGEGTPEDPILAPALPFVDVRPVATGGRWDGYDCPGGSVRNGPAAELVYLVSLPRKRTLRLFSFDRGGARLDVHVLAGAASEIDVPPRCIQSGRLGLAVTLDAGRYYVVVDGVAGDAGEHLLVALGQ